MKPYDAIVIGAGLNGLTAAAFLAQDGLRTLVLEQRNAAGGLAGPVSVRKGILAPGILPDTGSVAAKLLAPLRLKDHGLAFTKRRSALRLLLGDGARVTLSADPVRTQASLGAVSVHDADQYGRFRRRCEKAAPFMARLLLRPLPQRRRDLWPLLPPALAWWRSSAMPELMRIAPLSAKDWLDEHFEHDGFKAALAVPSLQAVFGGPFTPFGALHVLMRESMCSRHVVGGGTALATALENAARHLGVEIRTNVRAAEILVSASGTALGVRLATGKTVRGNLIAAACSPRAVFEDLLDPRSIHAEVATRTHHFRSRGTTACLALALNTPAPELAPQARIVPGIEALERAFDRAKRGSMPDSFALEVTTTGDAAVLSVLVHLVPDLSACQWTEAKRATLIQRVLAQLPPALAQEVQATRLLTPADIAQVYGIPGGHLYHLEHTPDQLLFRPAPGYSTPIDRLFLCGSGTHPGGGISCAPGALAARAMLRI